MFKLIKLIKDLLIKINKVSNDQLSMSTSSSSSLIITGGDVKYFNFPFKKSLITDLAA